MLQNIKKRTEGFTIIEVLIVLAIAGLIMLIVFLAIPALQRNSRNTRVKDDASKANGALQEAVNNNNGVIPAGTTAATSDPSVLRPANANYGIIDDIDYSVPAGQGFDALPNPLVKNTLYFRSSSKCVSGGGGQIGAGGGTTRQATVTYMVESPGTSGVTGVPDGYTAQCVGS